MNVRVHLLRRVRKLVGQAARPRAAPGDLRDERALAARPRPAAPRTLDNKP